VIFLKSGSDNVVSIQRDKISHSGDTYPRYIENLDTVIIKSYQSIDTIRFENINDLITITINSEVQYRIEYNGDSDDFLKTILREEKLNNLLK